MKFICSIIVLGLLLVVVNNASAGIIGHHPIEELDHSPPHYEFQYSVHDSHTGDVKDQFEHRRGDYVTGRYSLIEPDGLRRIVEYSADPLLGFTAQVRRELPIIRQLDAGSGTTTIVGPAGHPVGAVEEWPAPAPVPEH